MKLLIYPSADVNEERCFETHLSIALGVASISLRLPDGRRPSSRSAADADGTRRLRAVSNCGIP